MDKSLGALRHFWDVFQFTQSQLLPSPLQTMLDARIQNFSEFQVCIGWGEEELQDNFEKDALF